MQSDKYHFFIGNVLSDETQIKLLKDIQSKLKGRYMLKQYHTNNLFLKLIYLGYLDYETANKYMDNIISKLLKTVSDNFFELTCHYEKYDVNDDGSYYKISLEVDDENNDLSNKILPYLFDEGIKPIYEKKKNTNKPVIELIFYKSSVILDLKKEVNIDVPSSTFMIDHLALIKGNPTMSKSGSPSVHHQMHLEEVRRFTFPLNPR